MWYEGNPCNMHLLKLAEEVKRGVVRPPGGAFGAFGTRSAGARAGLRQQRAERLPQRPRSGGSGHSAASNCVL
jgi:hypothetical protein